MSAGCRLAASNLEKDVHALIKDAAKLHKKIVGMHIYRI